MQWQGRSRRKASGGKLRAARKKRKYEIGSDSILAVIGKEKRKNIRTRGGNKKTRTVTSTNVNITDPQTGITKKVTLKDVLENTANPNYVRRDIITKGCIIETEIGRARITSRPGHDGSLNAVLIGEPQHEK